MDKTILLDGYKVALRDGSMCVAVPSKGVLVLEGGKVFFLTKYRQDLTRYDVHELLDVMEIYDYSGKLVCNRKDKYKPSGQEILLFGMVDKKWNWLIVKKDGKALFCESKPSVNPGDTITVMYESTCVEIFKGLIQMKFEDGPINLNEWR